VKFIIVGEWYSGKGAILFCIRHTYVIFFDEATLLACTLWINTCIFFYEATLFWKILTFRNMIEMYLIKGSVCTWKPKHHSHTLVIYVGPKGIFFLWSQHLMINSKHIQEKILLCYLASNNNLF
jgi:hypothetical protein